ncbi:MAG: HAD family phosphatase [Proteiniphilum sp.]|uniref:HAD family hydrolase n=1 Tax=Proteiniphilum sp. TaxID=1926877 RepID=UPI002AB9B340|nr:HAD family phosphatase [Proteiniphilum sp.]MDY9919162.1 HAD family phosphatase [Proteiniphilum sp.]
MKPLKNIIFDFGGVLIDWNPIYLYQEIFDKEEDMNYFLEHVCRYEWNVLQDAGRSLAEGTRVLQEQYPEYRKEIAMYYGRWDEMLGGIIEENVKLIKPLKEKYNVYGLTNWSAETIPIAMERYDFFKDLDGMVVSGAEKIIKPDPQLYRILLERYGIQAGESLFIDDNYANIKTAQQLGFQTIHIVDGVNLEEVLKARAIL